MTTSFGTSDFFSKNNSSVFLDTSIQRIYFLIVKIDIFRGDLSDVSAKTATLFGTRGKRRRRGVKFPARLIFLRVFKDLTMHVAYLFIGTS